MNRFDGALLRARREQLGLTIEELSDLTGLTRRLPYAVVTDLESGAIRPSMDALEKLCRALGVEPSAVFSGELDDDDRPTDLGTATGQWIKDTLARHPRSSLRGQAASSAYRRVARIRGPLHMRDPATTVPNPACVVR
jgi:transcriptional regulator with XRE-family HTH domain